MASYATLQDMIDRFGEDAVMVSFDRNGTGTIDDAAVAQALADADGDINGYLEAAKYKLPLAATPQILVRMAAQLAMYHGSHGLALTEDIRQRYEDAVKVFEQIVKGNVTLGLPDDSDPVRGAEMRPATAGDQIFTRDTLAGR